MKKIPKWSKIAIIGTLMGTCFGAGVYAQDVLQRVDAYLRSDFKVVVNGKDIKLESPPLIYNNTSYLPVKELSGYLGSIVNWTESTKTIYINQRVNPNQPTEGNQTNYTEMTLQFPYAQYMDYRGATYPMLINMADQTYYRIVDLQRMGIRTEGMRKAKEKYTGELYVSEAELKTAVGNESPTISYTNFDPLVITGEMDPTKLKVLKAFVDQYRYFEINKVVLSWTPIILDKMPAENTYSYLLTDSGHFFRSTITLNPITKTDGTFDYSIGSSSKEDIEIPKVNN
ncbi:hypothetical protein A8709_23870 [Paenibacillus pectinilyticus]|uniref:Copper amine oxidase-like N-terminal domain-containing protein n=1 Tax=Paenibacillus pectinilyticus TaxID=512399 RepID=A0A1C1A8U3_9BACL|nr:stalk domain-containing protein [Paenibacillus pectinilyticus]OCT17031.1 hypothetical protein A8709_23870 [Paenibacillus pectinilyticus]